MAMRHIHYFICIRFSLLLKETNHISPRSKNSTHFKIDMKNQNPTDIVRLIRQIFQTKVYLFLFFILQVKIMNFLSLWIREDKQCERTKSSTEFLYIIVTISISGRNLCKYICRSPCLNFKAPQINIWCVCACKRACEHMRISIHIGECFDSSSSKVHNNYIIKYTILPKGTKSRTIKNNNFFCHQAQPS